MKFDYWQDFYCGEIYHMYNKSVSGVDLFREKQEYNNFLNGFKKYFSPYTSILAYCLIPNHFHFLIKINEFDHNRLAKEKTKSARLFLEGKINENAFLQDQMRRFFSGVALKINNKYNRQGSIFLNRTKRVALIQRGILNLKCATSITIQYTMACVNLMTNGNTPRIIAFYTMILQLLQFMRYSNLLVMVMWSQVKRILDCCTPNSLKISTMMNM